MNDKDPLGLKAELATLKQDDPLGLRAELQKKSPSEAGSTSSLSGEETSLSKSLSPSATQDVQDIKSPYDILNERTPSGQESALDKQLPYMVETWQKNLATDPRFASEKFRNAYRQALTKSYSGKDYWKLSAALDQADPYFQQKIADAEKAVKEGAYAKNLIPFGEPVGGTIENIKSGVEHGVKKIGETPEVAKEEGLGSAAFNAAVGVGETLMGAANIVPAVSAFMLTTEDAAEKVPQIQTILAPATESIEKVYALARKKPPSWLKNSGVVADFIWNILLFKGVQKGERITSERFQKALDETTPEELAAIEKKVEPKAEDVKVSEIENDIAKNPESPVAEILKEEVGKIKQKAAEEKHTSALKEAEFEVLKDEKTKLETETENLSEASKEVVEPKIKELDKRVKTMADELKVGDTVEMDVKPKEVSQSRQTELPEGFRYVEEGETIPAGDYQTRMDLTTEKTITNAPKTEKVKTKEASQAEKEVIERTETAPTIEETNKVAELVGLGEYVREPQTIKQWNEQADARIQGNKNIIPDTIQKIKDGKGDAVDQIVLGRQLASIDAELKKGVTDDLVKLYKEAKDANDLVLGATAGRILRARQEFRPIENTLGDMMYEKMQSAGVDKLTEAQKESVVKSYTEIAKAKEAADAKVAELQAKVIDLESRKQFEKIVKTKRRNLTKEKLDEEFTSLTNELSKIAKESMVAGAGVNPVLAAKASAVIGKMVRNRVEKGVVKLAEVVDSVWEKAKEFGLSKQDIHDIIAGKYAEKKQTKNQITSQLRDLKTEAQLINKLDALLKGEVPKTEAKVIERNRRIKELRDQISDIASLEKDIQGQESARRSAAAKEGKTTEEKIERIEEQERKEKLVEAERERRKFEQEFVKEKRTEKREALKAAINKQKQIEADLAFKTPEERAIETIKKRNETATAKLEKKIADKDYVVEERKNILENPEIKAKYPQLRKEALDALVKKEDARHQWEIDKMKDELANRNIVEKTYDWAKHTVTTARSIMAGIDDSFSFIQAGFSAVNHPVHFTKAWLEHWKDFVSEKRFERELAAMHNAPYWDLVKKSELDILEPKTMKEKEREGILDYNLLDENIKIKGKKFNIGQFTTRPFVRAFLSLGNNLRLKLFLEQADILFNQGKTFETHPKEFKDIATAINAETGRGKQHKIFDNELVRLSIWSPKLLSSGLNMLGVGDVFNPLTGKKGYYASLTPRARKYAIRQTVQGISIGLTTMALVKYNGGNADFDPRSVSFGDIWFSDDGNHYNVFGRYASIVRLIATSATGKKIYPDKEKETNAGAETMRFLRGKTAPIVGYGIDAFTGKTYMGQEFDAIQGAKDLVTPLSVQAIVDGLKQDGTISLLTRGIPSFEGIRVTNQKDFKKEEKPITEEDLQGQPLESTPIK